MNTLSPLDDVYGTSAKRFHLSLLHLGNAPVVLNHGLQQGIRIVPYGGNLGEYEAKMPSLLSEKCKYDKLEAGALKCYCGADTSRDDVGPEEIRIEWR